VGGSTGCWGDSSGADCFYRGANEGGTPELRPGAGGCSQYAECALGCCVVNGGVYDGGLCSSDKQGLDCHKFAREKGMWGSLSFANGTSCVGVPECNPRQGLFDALISFVRAIFQTIFG